MRNWPPNHSLLLHVDWPTIGKKAWCKALLDWAREMHELKKYYSVPVDVDAPGNTNQDFRDISWTWFRIKPNHMLWTQSIISTIFNVLFRFHWQLFFLWFFAIWISFGFSQRFDCIDVLGRIFLTWLAPAYDRTESARQNILWLLW